MSNTKARESNWVLVWCVLGGGAWRGWQSSKIFGDAGKKVGPFSTAAAEVGPTGIYHFKMLSWLTG